MADPRPCPLNPYVKMIQQDGTLMNLARVLEIEAHMSSACIHPPLEDLVFHGNLDGCTPLLLACGEGELASVEHIIKHWKTDVNAPGIYYHLDGVKFLGATPLIIASLKGHSDIVAYLITNGAVVSATASTQGDGWIDLLYNGLDPLHAALIDMRRGLLFFDKCAESSKIVRRLLAAGANPNTLDAQGNPLWAMDVCGVDAFEALVERGLNLNQLTSEGKTILQHWIEFKDYNTEYAEQERLDIIRLLVGRGANLKAEDANGFTPILLAAESSRLTILEGLLARNDIDRSEKVVAMELAGSHLLTPHKLDVEKAFGYWRRALELKEGTDPVNKNPLLISGGRVVEWVTSSEDLERVITRPEEYWVQSMLTRLRIYSEKRLKAVDNCLQSNYFYYIDLHPADYVYEDSCFYELVPPSDYHIATVMLTVLETIPRFHPGEEELPSLARVLEELFWNLRRKDPFFNKNNITSSMQLVLAADPDFHSKLPYGFFVILTGLPEALFHGSFREYLSYAARQDAGTLLSEACRSEDWKTLRFLLHLGADGNAIDDRRIQPPFHTAVIREAHRTALKGGREQVPNEMENSLTQLLFDYGANPYRINREGKTAVEIWVEKYCGEEGMESEAWNRRPYWCRDTVPKLISLAAKTIHTHAISYDDLPGNHPHATPKIIPKILQDFLEKN